MFFTEQHFLIDLNMALTIVIIVNPNIPRSCVHNIIWISTKGPLVAYWKKFTFLLKFAYQLKKNIKTVRTLHTNRTLLAFIC